MACAARWCWSWAARPRKRRPPSTDAVLVADLAERLAAGERTRGAVDEVAAIHGVARRYVYELALRLKHGDGAGGVDGPPPPLRGE